MKELTSQSLFFGMILSLLAYQAGLWIKRKFRAAILNPLLIAVILVIAVLLVTGTDLGTYNESAGNLSYLLTPATVSLAVPLYRQLSLLKKYPGAIMGGIAAGVVTSMVCVLLMSMAFGLTHEQYVTLLPKSITTAIGMGISEKLGGMTAITVAAIVITGIVGNIAADAVLRLLRIREPVARGLALGASAHVLGTARAMELGEIEGAMSSLSIVVAGVMTVAAAPLFARLL